MPEDVCFYHLAKMDSEMRIGAVCRMIGSVAHPDGSNLPCNSGQRTGVVLRDA